MNVAPTPCYRAINGKITKLDGSTLCVASAISLRRFYLDDIADIETRLGDDDPDLADVMIAHDLKCARELRVAIAAVSQAPRLNREEREEAEQPEQREAA